MAAASRELSEIAFRALVLGARYRLSDCNWSYEMNRLGFSFSFLCRPLSFSFFLLEGFGATCRGVELVWAGEFLGCGIFQSHLMVPACDKTQPL